MYVDPRAEKSMELYDRAAELIPGRVQLISRRASRFASGVSPVYAESAKGSRFRTWTATSTSTGRTRWAR